MKPNEKNPKAAATCSAPVRVGDHIVHKLIGRGLVGWIDGESCTLTNPQVTVMLSDVRSVNSREWLEYE